ncbi:Thromboxane-A synthase [Nymphon striatum]|nr:Thromboxane-A synthase [Nymphon striatum]
MFINFKFQNNIFKLLSQKHAILIVFIIAINRKKFSFYRYRKRKFQVFKKLGIKGPEPDVLTGNLKELGEKGPSQALTDWRNKYGDVFGYYIGPTPAIVIGGLDDLRQIQVKDFQYFTDRPDFVGGENKKDDISQHLVSLKGKKWKQIRTLLTPTFSASKMKKMSGIMNTAIDQLMNKIKLKGKSGEMFDIYEFYQELTIDIIGRTAFGIETNVQNKKDDPFLMNAKGIFSISLTNPVLVLQSKINFLIYSSIAL